MSRNIHYCRYDCSISRAGSQVVPINSTAVAISVKNLRCQVLWCTTEGEGAVMHDMGEAEVDQSDMAVSICGYIGNNNIEWSSYALYIPYTVGHL